VYTKRGSVGAHADRAVGSGPLSHGGSCETTLRKARARILLHLGGIMSITETRRSLGVLLEESSGEHGKVVRAQTVSVTLIRALGRCRSKKKKSEEGNETLHCFV